jgi:UDP-N-acetylmuramoyl-L-alanyl-D-glutamate--2,6-diaminopimelate ligase
VAFDVAVFTNLSRDHLDYHDSMEAYARAKQQLFNMPDLRYAVINLDDKHGQEILQGLPEGVQSVTYGMASSADVRGSELSLDGDGIHMNVQTSGASGQLQSSLLGRFNASNLLAVLAVLQVAGIKLEEALQQLASVTTVPGRMEKFSGTTPAPVVVVDYAHTPDALQAVLMALREHCDGSLVCVFGCGGDRDKGKRAMMGNVAEKLADKVVITDDNPRHEDGMQIIEDILSGTSQSGRIEVQRDRVKAITQAFNKAQHGDVILVAGKGHEDYQQVGDEKRPYSDRETVKALFGDAA